MKRLILILLISLLFFPIAASPEFWFGASFIADRNMLSPEIADKFPAMDEEVSQIRSLGISVDLAFFPWNQVRIGPVLSSDTLLPIGYTGTSGDNQGYITYDFDFREDLMVGLGYHQFFTDKIGMVISLGYYYSWYRTAKEHIANESAPMEFVYASDSGLMAEAGILSRSDNMYFRLGINFSYCLKHRDQTGFRLGLFAGGGFIIG